MTAMFNQLQSVTVLFQ